MKILQSSSDNDWQTASDILLAVMEKQKFEKQKGLVFILDTF